MIGIAARRFSDTDIRLFPHTLKLESSVKQDEKNDSIHLARGTRRRAMVISGQEALDRTDGDGKFESSERFSTEPYISNTIPKTEPKLFVPLPAMTESAPQPRGSSSLASSLGRARFR